MKLWKNPHRKKSLFAQTIKLVTIFILTFGSACSPPLGHKTPIPQNALTPTALPKSEKPLPTPIWIMADISPVLYGSFQELAYWNEIIVIGAIVGVDDAFIPKDESHEFAGILHSEFQVARVYQVQVAEYLKGEGETTITVAQPLNFLLISCF